MQRVAGDTFLSRYETQADNLSPHRIDMSRPDFESLVQPLQPSGVARKNSGITASRRPPAIDRGNG